MPRRQQAHTYFDRAQRLREALTGRPEEERTRKDYQRVIDAYRRVYYADPGSSKADQSARAVAELLAEEGRTLQDDPSFESAIGQYEFLRREYPGSKFRVDALFTEGQIYHENLHDEAKAKETFQEFLKRYPHSHLAEQAQEALDEIAKAEQAAKKKLNAKARGHRGTTESSPRVGKAEEPHPADEDTNTDADKTAVVQPAKAGHSRVLVTGIRHWSTPDYTRVAIDLEDEVKYEAGRVPSPDRIFFDLQNAKLASELVGKTFEIGDGFLRKIRVAPYRTSGGRASTNHAGTVRIVLDVDDVSEYSAFLLPNPYRLIIDIHGNKDGAKRNETQSAQGAHSAPLQNSPVGKSHETYSAPVIAPSSAEQPALDQSSTDQENSPSELAKLTQSANEQKATEKPTSNPVVAKVSPRRDNTPRTQSPTHIEVPPETSDDEEASTGASPAKSIHAPDKKPVTHADSSTPAGSTQTSSTRVRDLDEDSSSGVRAKKTIRKGRKTAVGESSSIHVAEPTADGQRSLIRALGLKIGRIVVDAGHGGHDTGTIGPNGLLEKDLVLDVALKLGKLLEKNLGAEVVYTRDDDTFVPLETRTAIANKEQADLFISVHANSSHDPSARGIETYYLNFTSSSEALEVAGRENAVSEKSIHELQDLVKKIALKEKIEESREFASDVEASMHETLVPRNPGLRDRGVKKAPFIVLIGANMPSILSEISFVSNPQDERKLQTPEYRQKIALALYKGVAKYVGGLSGVKIATKSQPVVGQ